MFAIPLCDWCGVAEVGSVSGGHHHYCSDACAEAEEAEEQAEFDQVEADYKAEMANERWFEERGGVFWDDPRGA